MMHSGHRVEEMREMRRAPSERGNGVAEIGGRVADREEDAIAEMFDDRACAVAFRRDGDDPAEMRRERVQRCDFIDARRANRRSILRSRALAIDVRPFEMHAANLR